MARPRCYRSAARNAADQLLITGIVLIVLQLFFSKERNKGRYLCRLSPRLDNSKSKKCAKLHITSGCKAILSGNGDVAPVEPGEHQHSALVSMHPDCNLEDY